MSSADELRDLCARLVAAADDERRRIERALHDGIQQDLIAVSVQLQLARRLAGTDVAAANAVQEEIGLAVHEALERVQALANEIYPSLLEGRGLPDTLRALASSNGIGVRVDAAGVSRYPTEVEAALYFCCRAILEAVASDIGGDAHVEIRIHEEERALVLWIDSGTTSLEVAARALGSARDRIHALGGVIAIETGESRLVATVPLA